MTWLLRRRPAALLPAFRQQGDARLCIRCFRGGSDWVRPAAWKLPVLELSGVHVPSSRDVFMDPIETCSFAASSQAG